MDKTYLLTGATGVIGSSLFKHLMTKGENVVLLLRASSEENLKFQQGKLEQSNTALSKQSAKLEIQKSELNTKNQAL